MFAVVVASAVAVADVVFAVAVANFVVGLLLLQSGTHHIAYFRVHSRASSLYFSRSVLYILAISGTSGSSGLGSQSREQIDNKTAKGRKEKKVSKSHTTGYNIFIYILRLVHLLK